jgi:hypothetical protein
VIELCPVGALTSTQYRFLGRPWEIQNVPTVCGLCPVGCNVHATMREGKVRRMLSRNHPEVDEGWLCDKGRFAFTHLYARDRITDPLRPAAARLRGASWDDALDEAGRPLRRRKEDLTAPRARRPSSRLRAWQAPAPGSRRTRRVLPEATSSARSPRLPLGDPRRRARVARRRAVSERAPIVDLWLRAARRAARASSTPVTRSRVAGVSRRATCLAAPRASGRS